MIEWLSYRYERNPMSEHLEDGENGSTDGDDGINRRTYLKAGTAAAAGSAAASGSATAVGTTVADEEYEVIEAAGQTIHVNCGETFENKLIDLTTGEALNVAVQGGYATIRNIGFEGIYRGDGFMFSITAEEGPILFENIYLGDGATKEGADFVHGPGGFFYHAVSNADVTFRNVNVQGYPNNGFYCSNTASGGTVTFDTCFGKNNGVSTFRCGDPEDSIVDCVAYNDDTDYGEGYGGYVEENGRPVWAWSPGGFTIEDSHFAAGTYSYAMVAGANDEGADVEFVSGAIDGEINEAHGSTVTLGDEVGDDPDLSIQDGVPTSPEEAASAPAQGSAFDDPDCPEHADLPHLYEFVGRGNEPSDYFFEIEEGPIVPVDEGDAVIDDEYQWIHEDGHKAAGRVEPDETHAYRFGTLIVDATIDGAAEAYINDSSSNLDLYPQEGASGDDWKSGFPWQDEEEGEETETPTETPEDTPTETPEETPTETDEPEESDDAGETDESVPGFGVIGAIGALAASGSAVVRRLRNRDDDDT